MKKEFILIILFFITITCIFFNPVIKGYIPFPGDLIVGTNPYNSQNYGPIPPGGVPNKAQGVDVIRESYPWKHFSIELLKKGQIPFWNPYNFSGNPLAANFQSAVFYPINILFFLLPFNSAWTIFIFLIPLLSAVFTYLFMREIKVGKIPAIFSSIVFAFSSYMTVWLEYGNIGHTFLWLPLGLFITEKLILNFRLKYLLFLNLVLFTAILAGYIQGYFYMIIILIFYYISKSLLTNKIKIKSMVFYLIAIFYPFLLSAFQLLPTIELFQHSSRNSYSLDQLEKLLNPWWYLITVIAPDFFGNPASRNHWFSGTYIERVSFFGVIPLVLTIVAMLNFKKRKETIAFSVLFFGSLILAYDILFIKYLYTIQIPIISTTVPTRALSILIFSGAILGGFGLETLLKNSFKKQVFIASGITFIFLIPAWGYSLFNSITISQRNLIIPTTLIVIFIIISTLFLKNKKLKTIFIITLFAITLFDLFRFFHKITPFTPPEYIYPPTPVISYIKKNAGINRYWGFGSGHLETNFQLYDHTFIPDGHDALHIKKYTELLSASKNGKIQPQISRSDSEITPGFGSDDLKNNLYRKKIMNLLGVKYLLIKDETIYDDRTFKLLWQDKTWKIYENLQVAPRAFLTKDYIVTDKKDAISTFYSKKFDEKKSLILEEKPNLSSQQLKTKKVKILKYQPSEIQIATESDTDALLFLSDAYYDGWNASIDGIPARIYNADYAFRAVRVNKGTHHIIFSYYPKSFDTGLKISILAFGILIAGLFIIHKKKISN